MSASASEEKCLICGSKKEDPSTPLTAFTQISWDKFKQAAEARQDDTYEKLKEIRNEKVQGCYHRKYYQSYTHKQHIERLQRKRKSEDSLKNTSNQPVKSTRSAQQKTTLRKCIICQKDKINKTSGSCYEPLSDLQMFKASNTLKNAATIRDDQRILLEISGKGLVAIEVKYHR